MIGTGAIGVLTACFLRLLDWQTWVAGLAPESGQEAGIVAGLGARYV